MPTDLPPRRVAAQRTTARPAGASPPPTRDPLMPEPLAIALDPTRKPGAMGARIATTIKDTGKFVQHFDTVCGSTLEVQSQVIGTALERLAKENPKARKLILALLETSAWGEVFLAFTPVMLTVLIHHDLLPAHAKAKIGVFFGNLFTESGNGSEANGTGSD